MQGNKSHEVRQPKVVVKKETTIQTLPSDQALNTAENFETQVITIRDESQSEFHQSSHTLRDSVKSNNASKELKSSTQDASKGVLVSEMHIQTSFSELEQTAMDLSKQLQNNLNIHSLYDNSTEEIRRISQKATLVPKQRQKIQKNLPSKQHQPLVIQNNETNGFDDSLPEIRMNPHAAPNKSESFSSNMRFRGLSNQFPHKAAQRPLGNLLSSDGRSLSHMVVKDCHTKRSLKLLSTKKRSLQQWKQLQKDQQQLKGSMHGDDNLPSAFISVNQLVNMNTGPSSDVPVKSSINSLLEQSREMSKEKSSDKLENQIKTAHTMMKQQIAQDQKEGERQRVQLMMKMLDDQGTRNNIYVNSQTIDSNPNHETVPSPNQMTSSLYQEDQLLQNFIALKSRPFDVKINQPHKSIFEQQLYNSSVTGDYDSYGSSKVDIFGKLRPIPSERGHMQKFQPLHKMPQLNYLASSKKSMDTGGKLSSSPHRQRQIPKKHDEHNICQRDEDRKKKHFYQTFLQDFGAQPAKDSILYKRQASTDNGPGISVNATEILDSTQLRSNSQFQKPEATSPFKKDSILQFSPLKKLNPDSKYNSKYPLKSAYLVLKEHIKEKDYRDFPRQDIKVKRQKQIIDSQIQQQKQQVKHKYRMLGPDTLKNPRLNRIMLFTKNNFDELKSFATDSLETSYRTTDRNPYSTYNQPYYETSSPDKFKFIEFRQFIQSKLLNHEMSVPVANQRTLLTPSKVSRHNQHHKLKSQTKFPTQDGKSMMMVKQRALSQPGMLEEYSDRSSLFIEESNYHQHLN